MNYRNIIISLLFVPLVVMSNDNVTNLNECIAPTEQIQDSETMEQFLYCEKQGEILKKSSDKWCEITGGLGWPLFMLCQARSPNNTNVSIISMGVMLAGVIYMEAMDKLLSDLFLNTAKEIKSSNIKLNYREIKAFNKEVKINKIISEIAAWTSIAGMAVFSADLLYPAAKYIGNFAFRKYNAYN